MRIVMTLNVRDEADIIEDNLRFHAAQGVDAFVVADHGSTDGTRALLQTHVDAGVVELVPVEARDILDLHEQHMTRLAHVAADLGADWVIHNDADEFWWPVVGDLRQALAMVEDEYGLLLAPRAEFLPRPGESAWPERLRVREARARQRPKLAHRPHPELRLHGVHPANLWVEVPGGQAFPGPPKFRTAPDRVSADPDVELVLAPVFPVRVLHFPLRSFDQYRRRVEIALETEGIWGKRGKVMREAMDSGRLPELYEQLMLPAGEVEAGLASGALVEDAAFGEYLRACPDPAGAGAPPVGAGACSQELREAELAELRLDAMASLSVRLQKVARDADPRSQQDRKRTRAKSRSRGPNGG